MAAIFDFMLRMTTDGNRTTIVVLSDPENLGKTVEISSL